MLRVRYIALEALTR